MDVSVNLVSSETSLTGLQMATFSLLPLAIFSLCAPLVSPFVSRFLCLIRTPAWLDESPPWGLHFSFISSFKTLFKEWKIVTFWGTAGGGGRASIDEFGRDIIQSIIAELAKTGWFWKQYTILNVALFASSCLYPHRPEYCKYERLRGGT